MKKLLIFSFVIMMFTACRDEAYSPGYSINYATIENPNQRNAFYFVTDNDNKCMFTAASNLYQYYRPKHRQRAIISYTILNEKPADHTYHHDVRLNDIINIPTKEVYYVSSGTLDNIGDDVIRVNDMWICDDFLNVNFEYQGMDQVHLVNLVYNPVKTYADEKLHLELRHNCNGDQPSYRKKGVVAFDLLTLKNKSFPESNQITLAIHVNEKDKQEEKIYEIVYKHSENTPSKYVPREKLDIKQFQAYID